MAATVEAPPTPVPSLALVEEEDAGSWRDADIARLAELLDAADASEAKWAAGDALVALLPIDRHARDGTHARIRELADRVGRSPGFLRSLRTTSANWPACSRKPWVSWHVARIYTVGGPGAASQRAAQLARLRRGRGGRVSVETFRAWRNVSVAPSRTGGSRRVTAVRVHPWLLFVLTADFERRRRQHAIELRQDVYELIERVGCHSADGRWLVVKRALDGVLAAVDAVDG